MKRRLTLGVAVCAALLGGGAAVFVAVQPRVSPEAIETAVVRTPELVQRAWHLPVAAAFNSEVTWQSNGSRCGPASIANAFRSIGEEETTEVQVLEGTGKCWTGFCIIGLTLDELAEVARAHTERKVSVLRDLTAEQFREHMKHSNDPDRRYIINFTREEAEDVVFVLDVNENYKPWLIESDRLFKAMDTFDGDRKRGLLMIQ